MALKQQMVARLTGANAVSAAQLARETGITQQNLSRWLSKARNSPFGSTGDGIVSLWTVEQKARIIAQAAELAGEQFAAYLQGEGVKLAHFKRWRFALKEAGQESVGIRKRIAKLERELARKDRALAEAATTWVLRETIESEIQHKDDGIDEQAEEEQESDSAPSTGPARARSDQGVSRQGLSHRPADRGTAQVARMRRRRVGPCRVPTDPPGALSADHASLQDLSR
jgi:transposase